MRKLLMTSVAVLTTTNALAQDVITTGHGTTPRPISETPIPISSVNDSIDSDLLSMEIIVTAERKEQFARDYPAAIEVLSSDELENIALVHAAEALNSVAGVHIHRGSGLEHLTSVRSPVLTGGAGAGSFLHLQDGIPFNNAGNLQ